MDAVLTTCPPSPCALMCGRNAWMPWTAPMKLTPISQSQSVSVMASTGPPIPTPALLQTTCWTLPKAAKVSSAARTTEARSETSQATARASAPEILQVAQGRVERALLDVREHHLRPLRGEGAGQGEADAAGRAGHEGGSSVEASDHLPSSILAGGSSDNQADHHHHPLVMIRLRSSALRGARGGSVLTSAIARLRCAVASTLLVAAVARTDAAM